MSAANTGDVGLKINRRKGNQDNTDFSDKQVEADHSAFGWRYCYWHPNSSLPQFASAFCDAAMTPEDIKMAQDTAVRLNAKPGVKAGDQAMWQNPKSGAHGVVDIHEVVTAASPLSGGHKSKTLQQVFCQALQGRSCKLVDVGQLNPSHQARADRSVWQPRQDPSGGCRTW